MPRVLGTAAADATAPVTASAMSRWTAPMSAAMTPKNGVVNHSAPYPYDSSGVREGFLERDEAQKRIVMRHRIGVESPRTNPDRDQHRDEPARGDDPGDHDGLGCGSLPAVGAGSAVSRPGNMRGTGAGL